MSPQKSPRVCSNLRRLLLAAVIILAVSIQTASPCYSSENSYHFVRTIVVDPRLSDTLYLATDNQGLIKSIDGGKTWQFINRGIKNYLVYDLKLSLTTPGRLYASSWGGGFYQSEDGGGSWREINEGLNNTAVGKIEIQPDPKGAHDHLFIGTSTELYERRDDQNAWHPIVNQVRFWNGPQFQNSLIVEPYSATLFLGTERGALAITLETAEWKEISLLTGKRIGVMAANPETGWLYAGTIGKGELFVSHDHGIGWQSTGNIGTSWIRAILFDPSKSKRLYVATSDLGILRSDDEGKSWKSINAGLPDKDVRTISLDVKHPEHLFAGLHGSGLYKSTDGGALWTKVPRLPFLSLQQQTALIDAQNCSSPNQLPTPPRSFLKCNQCHGWTDPHLNQRPTYWRAAANRRNWEETIARMSQGMAINNNEMLEIATYLNLYTSLTANRTEEGSTDPDKSKNVVPPHTDNGDPCPP